MSPQALKIWLGVSLLVALVAAPYLARGDQSANLLKQKYAAQIARMSDSQRARLLQNEAQYRASTAEKKLALHTLHAALERDRIHGQGELTAVMQRYDAWLKTIEPYQREQLNNMSTPAERIALMQEVVSSQRARTARRNMPFFGPGGERLPWAPPPMLDETSLRNVMQALEQAADHRFTDAQRQELNQLQGVNRDFKLLRILKDVGTGLHPKPLMEEPPLEFKEVAADIDKYTDDERIRNFIHDGPTLQDAPPERISLPESRLAGLISQSLLAELFKLRRAAHQHLEVAKLQAFLESLPPDRQYELLALEASDFQIDLRNQYLDSSGLSDLPGIQDLRELFGRGSMRGGPPGGPGGPDRGPFGFRGFRGNRPPRGGSGEGRNNETESSPGKDKPRESPAP